LERNAVNQAEAADASRFTPEKRNDMKKLYLTLFALLLAGSPLLAETSSVQPAGAEAKSSTVASTKKQKKHQRKLRKKNAKHTGVSSSRASHKAQSVKVLARNK
jgi:hypothetical protein